MITVFHTSSKTNEKLIEFRDNWITENPNTLVYPDFQDYDAPYSDLLRNMEIQDVIIFIMTPLTHKVGALLTNELRSFERILHKVEFKYINHAGIVMMDKRLKVKKFKATVSSLDLINFFEANFNDFKTLTNYYISLNPYHRVTEEFNSANVFSKKRHFNLVFGRQLMCYLLHNNKITYTQIMHLLGMCDHTSAMNSFNRVKNYVDIYAQSYEINIINKLQIKLGEEICKLN